ncbi:MAG: tail fiber domain-containing protein [Phycisphaerales bacterium]
MPFGLLVRAVPALVIVASLLTSFRSALAQAPVVQAAVWGYSGFNLRDVPPLPTGVSYSALSAGNYHIAALRSDGSVVSWGNNSNNVLVVPALPKGVRYTAVSSGSSHTLALRSDGAVVAWGVNTQGQCNVPAIPASVRYVAIEAGYQHSLALRSDGLVMAWGLNTSFQCTVPSLPLNTTYTAIAAGEAFSMALRSDGTIAAWGSNSQGQRNVPLPVNGGSFTSIAAGGNHGVALRSDGSVVAWGNNAYGQAIVPVAPAGLTYTAVAAGHFHTLALRSDGSVVGFGQNFYGQTELPTLPAGTTFTGISAGHLLSMGTYSAGQPAGNAFTFKGHLESSGLALNGAADMRFTLWDAEVGGRQKGPQLEFAAVAVQGGLFSISLDFGPSAFDGTARYLEMVVRQTGASEWTTLNPRQRFTATPYANYATTAHMAEIAAQAQTANVATMAEGVAWSSISGIPPAIADGGPWMVLANGDLSVVDRSVGIGTPAPGAGFKLDVAGSVRAVGLVQTSTGRLKKDVRTLGGALELIDALRAVRYVWNADAPAGVVGRSDIGFVAEEVGEVLPEIVSRDSAGRTVGLDYGRLVSVSVQAIKEQQIQIKAQNASLESLKNENAALRARLEAIERALADRPAAGGVR